MSNFKMQHVGWQDENIRVQDTRRPFIRHTEKVLRLEGMPAMAGMPSEQRAKAGVDVFSYYTYPLLFYTSFPDVSLAQLRLLSLCGSYLYDYILCLDDIFDRSTTCNVGATLLSGILHREALSGLHTVFSSESAFWRYFDRYHSEFVQAVLCERARHHCCVRPYSTAELEAIYAGKPALAKACIAALALLNQSEELIEPFTASHDSFYVGFQLFDDLVDWQLDYRRRHYSYLLTAVFQQVGWEQRVESGRPPAPNEVNELLQTSGIVEETLALALSYLDRAEGLLAGLSGGSWVAAIQQTRQRMQQYRFAVDTAVPPPPVSATPGLDWSYCAPATVAPIASNWLEWLDHTSVPHVDDPEVAAIQQRCLCASHALSTVGAAICQVGLAVATSTRVYPDRTLSIHLGMSEGELAWCRHNETWLHVLLALCLDTPAYFWTPADAAAYRAFSGWVPPAVGRYLGYQMVKNYPGGISQSDDFTVATVLDHYRRQVAA